MNENLKNYPEDQKRDETEESEDEKDLLVIGPAPVTRTRCWFSRIVGPGQSQKSKVKSQKAKGERRKGGQH